jgi:hypothetical protein
LRPVWRAHQGGETIGHEGKIGVRPVATGAGRLLVQRTSGELVRESRVSTEGRHSHPHRTDDAGNDADEIPSILSTGQEAVPPLSNGQRRLRQSVRHLIELAGHTEIVAEHQARFTARQRRPPDLRLDPSPDRAVIWLGPAAAS